MTNHDGTYRSTLPMPKVSFKLRIPEVAPVVGCPLPRVVVWGIRTSAFEPYGETSQRVVLEMKDGWLRVVEGGTSGHESMPVKHAHVARSCGWTACAGTKWFGVGSRAYDRLFIPKGQFRKVIETFGL